MEIIHILIGKADMKWQYQVNRMVYLMASEQKRSGQSVQIWNVSSRLNRNYAASSKQMKIFQPAFIPFFIPMELMLAMRKNPNAVYHFHGAWVPLFWRLSKFCQMEGIRFVFTPHGGYAPFAKDPVSLWKMAYFQFFEKYLLCRAHKIHTDGASDFDGLQALYPNQKSILLNLGFRPRSAVTIQRTSDAFVLGTIVSFDRMDDTLTRVIEAFVRFKRVYMDAELILIGDGKSKKEFEMWIAKMNWKGIRFLGKKYGEEKDEHLASLHGYLHFEHKNDRALGVLEAAARGVPSIVTPFDKLKQDITDFHAGIVTQGNEINDWVSAMSLLYHQSKRKRNEDFSRSTFRMLNEAFNWKKLLPKYQVLYT
jgi:glycosyltransferase involved in cell wall biosynthesis